MRFSMVMTCLLGVGAVVAVPTSFVQAQPSLGVDGSVKPPRPKVMTLVGTGTVVAGDVYRVDAVISKQCPIVVRELHSRLDRDRRDRPGLAPIDVSVIERGKIGGEARDIQQVLDRPQAYALSVRRERIRVVASDVLGAIYGINRLIWLLLEHKGRLPECEIRDWPDIGMRAFHFGGLRVLSKQKIKEVIDHARRGQFTTLILQLSNSVRFPAMGKIASDDGWSIDEFQDIVQYARQSGLEVIPEIKLLSHQEKFFRNLYPALMFNVVTYDPRKQEVYQKVFPILDEIIRIIQPRAIHIGHDEVVGPDFPKKNPYGVDPEKISMLPANLYRESIRKIHAYLSQRNIETWIWGDMLIAPDEFPTMLAKHLHGRSGGYAALRTHLPKDIVICDWHYHDRQPDFPSAKAFADAGYRVLGATWDDERTTENFSRYMKQKVGERGRGMVLTSWHLIRNDLQIRELMDSAADIFWNASGREGKPNNSSHETRNGQGSFFPMTGFGRQGTHGG